MLREKSTARMGETGVRGKGSVVSKGWGRRWSEGEGHVAGAAAKVEDDGVGAGEDGAHGARGATPPQAVDAGGEQVVQQVVARGYGRRTSAGCSGRQRQGRRRRWGRAPGLGSVVGGDSIATGVMFKRLRLT